MTIYKVEGNEKLRACIAGMILILLTLGVKGMPTLIGTLLARIFASASVLVLIPRILGLSILKRRD